MALNIGGAVSGQFLEITVRGEVEFNQINSGVFGKVSAGDLATLTFQIDTTDFVDSPNFPTRGYPIIQRSWILGFDSGVQIGLQQPFPDATTPYFALRNDDPAVDGFFISTSFDNPFGVPIAESGLTGTLINDFSVTYGGELLETLDIASAPTSYDFAGLTVFNWTINDGPFNPVGILFSSMEFGMLGSCPNLLGDVNGDGLVNLLDVAPFVTLIADGGFECGADVNQDGAVDLLDVGPFVSILAGG